MTHPKTRPYGPKRHREGQPDLRGLDEIHRRLVTAACAGEVAVFEKTDVLDADVLAALITGRSYKGRAPWPATSKGVRVKGGRVETRLVLSQSQIDEPLALESMDLPEGVDLTGARTKGLVFNNCTLKDIHLPGAFVSGQFNANNAKFKSSKGIALWAQSAEVSGGMFLNNATLIGQCDINNARIGYQFSATSAEFSGAKGVALWAQSAEITAGVFLNKTRVNGQCDFAGTKIGGVFSASNAEFNNPDNQALRAQGAVIARGVFIRNATLNGQCDINNAKIGYQFSANHAVFNTPHGTALWAQGAQIGAGVFLKNAHLKGICDFNSAQTAEIFLTDASLIGQFRGDFGARFKGLDLRRANLISARRHQIDPDFIGPRRSADPALRDPNVLTLTDARIGRLDMPQAQGSLEGIVVLTRCHIEHFCDHKHAWPEALEQEGNTWVTPPSRRDPETGEDIGYYDLNGFTYDYLAAPNGGSANGAEESTAEARKRWLLNQRAHDIADQFKPQPWRQMAARLEAQGHDDAARKIALFRRQIHRQSKAVTGGRVAFSWLLDKLSHYGFNPWLTMAWSGGVVGFCALVYGCSAATGPMPDGGYSPFAGYSASGPASDANANPPPVFIRAQADDVTAATNISDLPQADPFLSRVYPDFNPLLYSLDVFVPVLDLGMEVYWRPNPNYVTQDTFDLALNFWIILDRQFPALRWILPEKLHPLSQNWIWLNGSILYWLTIVQRFLGAILIAIMVTSFTGLLTREDKLS